ncbi:hypothetical protein BDV95DRAFT_614174 [Massariosphaeria phaeospora]|uniref:Uncharacterized protein n=1 Tax=Massariosphaeria phaeospora TaxID=100035 RepID=A0A7C8MGE3_9PLEO|nr:hypothetical protein BDV95DRAFT_614174 [Massariosphaeria phaeospora]
MADIDFAGLLALLQARYDALKEEKLESEETAEHIGKENLHLQDENIRLQAKHDLMASLKGHSDREVVDLRIKLTDLTVLLERQLTGSQDFATQQTDAFTGNEISAHGQTDKETLVAEQPKTLDSTHNKPNNASAQLITSQRLTALPIFTATPMPASTPQFKFKDVSSSLQRRADEVTSGSERMQEFANPDPIANQSRLSHDRNTVQQDGLSRQNSGLEDKAVKAIESHPMPPRGATSGPYTSRSKTFDVYGRKGVNPSDALGGGGPSFLLGSRTPASMSRPAVPPHYHAHRPWSAADTANTSTVGSQPHYQHQATIPVSAAATVPTQVSWNMPTREASAVTPSVSRPAPQQSKLSATAPVFNPKPSSNQEGSG